MANLKYWDQPMFTACDYWSLGIASPQTLNLNAANVMVEVHIFRIW